MRHVPAVKENLTCRRVVQLNDGASHRGLAAAGFADNAECAALVDGKRHIVHRVERPARRFKILFQVLYL